MATTYNHCQIAIVDASGNVSVIYPITQAQDVSVVRTSNANLPTTVTTAQKLANALGALAFKNVADIISTDGATTSTTKTWSSSVINTKLTELSSKIPEFIYIGGYVNGENEIGLTKNMDYPSGYNVSNTIVSAIRIKNPYGSFVDNDYYVNYHVDIVLMDAFISYGPGESCTKYMEWVALLQKIIWNTNSIGEINV